MYDMLSRTFEICWAMLKRFIKITFILLHGKMFIWKIFRLVFCRFVALEAVTFGRRYLFVPAGGGPKRGLLSHEYLAALSRA
jgi:hypothetical protein